MNTELLNAKDGSLHTRGIARKPYKQSNENSFENKRRIPKPHFDDDAPTETPQMFSIYADPNSVFYKQKKDYNFDSVEHQEQHSNYVSISTQQTVEQKPTEPKQRKEIRQNSPDSLPYSNNQIKIKNQNDNFYKVQISNQTTNPQPIECPPTGDKSQASELQNNHDLEFLETTQTRQSILKKENNAKAHPKGQLKALQTNEQGSLKAAGIEKAKTAAPTSKQKKKNHSIFARLRNALIGMSLAYMERLESIAEPLLFIAKNYSTLLVGFLHLFMPVTFAWFISNWNEQLQSQFWGNHLAFNISSFISLTVVCAFPWSIFFLISKSLLSYISGAINQFANQGASYLEKNKT